MQPKHSLITLVGAGILLLFALTLISFVPRPEAIHALASDDDFEPMVGFDTIEYTVTAGEYVNAGLLFAYFPCNDKDDNGECDHNDKFTKVTYRFDILQNGADADNCEGQGWGSARNFSPSFYSDWRTLGPIPLRVSGNCPAGDYTMKCMVTYTEPGSTEAIPLTCNGDLTIRAVQQSTATPTATTEPTATPTDTPEPTPTPTEEPPGQQAPPQEDPTATPTATSTSTTVPPPVVKIENLPSAYDEGSAQSFNLVFKKLENSVQYGYRADVTDDENSAADDCEGTALGGNQQFTGQVTGDADGQISVSAAISAQCPPDSYTVTLSLFTNRGLQISTNQSFQVLETSNSDVEKDTPTPTATPTVNDSLQQFPEEDHTPTPTFTPMPPPSVRIDGLPASFDQGQQTSLSLIFQGIDDSDEYNYRADVTKADNSAADDCEGNGLGGANQYTSGLTGAVNGQITVPGLIDARCPSDTYTLTVKLIAAGGFTYTATQAFQVNGGSLSPIATDTPAPTNTPTQKVSYSPPPQQKQPVPTATPMPIATAPPTQTPTPAPTLTPTVTLADDLTGDFPDRITIIVDDEDADSGADTDTDTTSSASQTASTDDASGSGWPGHYAAGRSVWDCRDLSALVDSLAALRGTMTFGDHPQAVTQPEIMNARLGPGLAYDVITTLPEGTRANIIGIDPRGEWYQLELSSLEIPVWIYQSLAGVEGTLANVREVPAAELAELPVSGAPGSRPVAFIVPEVMNVRLGPAFDYEVLTTLPQGTKLEVVGIAPSGEWLQVELEGMRSLGWLYRDLVVVDCPLVNVRRITEREISLVPAALTQPYALHAFSGPGLAYDRVAILPRGTWAQITAIGDCPPNVWYQVIVPGLDEPVWVVRDFVKVAVGSLAGLPLYGFTDFTPPAAEEGPIAVTQPDPLNVRTGPGLEHAVVAEVPQGTQARIYGADPSESWLLVELEGHSTLLWIYRPMTRVQGSLVGVRRVTAAEITAQPAVLTQPQAVFGRSGPGTEYTALTILPKGTWARVVGIGPRYQWLLVQVVGMDEPVWVLCDLLKIIGSLAGIPQVVPQ